MLTVKTISKMSGDLFSTESIFEAKRTWTSKEADQGYTFHYENADGDLG